MERSNPVGNLALQLVQVTEAAALAAGRFMGRNDKNGSDAAAVEAMRLMLNSIDMDGTVIIGEGEKDDAPMLFNGERLGTGRSPEVDIAVDPIDGTRLLALGRANALATVAVSDRGSMFDPGPFVYMQKIAVGPVGKGVIDVELSPMENLSRIAEAKGCDVADLTVVVLDRPRHEQLILELRATKARIRMITDGDVAGAVMTAWPDSGIDVLMGVGGTPEGVISACALRCMGGELQGKLWPRNNDEIERGRAMGFDFDVVLSMDDLVRSENCFFAATGITDGELVDGVKYYGNGARTHSLVMRSASGTVREIATRHRWEKLMRFSNIANGKE
ncbi:MAG: class II fructose-bisphosphatase [Anaerolineales bacterium]|nr:class II fructose-bisphosphatase [Anaerolineales bacterium]|tara:strand:- start:232 stop:1227 length:996 start_codon:yes stop_codon:yes gene_type:complete